MRGKDDKLRKENRELRQMLGAHLRAAGGHLLIPCLECKVATGNWCTTCYAAVCANCEAKHDVTCQTELLALRAENARFQRLIDGDQAAKASLVAERDALREDLARYQGYYTATREALQIALRNWRRCWLREEDALAAVDGREWNRCMGTIDLTPALPKSKDPS